MPQHTLQSDDLTLAAAPNVSPFDDIASVHELYADRIFRFLLLSTRNRDLAQSLTQDTLLTAWRTRSSFRGDCALYTWLNHIAINLLRSHTRTQTFRFWRRAAADSIDIAELTHQLANHATSAESALLAHEKLAAVWQTVAALSPTQRSIFLLRYIEEIEIADIALAMNMPVPTVKTHLYGPLDRIRSAHNPNAKKSNSKVRP